MPRASDPDPTEQALRVHSMSHPRTEFSSGMKGCDAPRHVYVNRGTRKAFKASNHNIRVTKAQTVLKVTNTAYISKYYRIKVFWPKTWPYIINLQIFKV